MYAYRMRSVRIRLAETGAEEIVQDQRDAVFQNSFTLSLSLLLSLCTVKYQRRKFKPIP